MDTIRIKQIQDIIALDFNHENYQRVSRILHEIFANSGTDNDFYEGERSFTPTRKEELIQELGYKWRFFGSKKIEWKEWSDIAKEGLILIKEFIDSDLDDYKDLSEYEEFVKRVHQRVRELIDAGKYDNEFRELGKDD